MNKRNLTLDYSAPYRTGGNLYRVIISHSNEGGKLYRHYEVWATQEAIMDKLNLSSSPTNDDLFTFTVRVYEDRLKETNEDIPEWEGAFVTNESGARYGDYRTFPGSMSDSDPLIKTNISLPSSLHKWLRMEAAEHNKSISEIIRFTLDQYRKSK